MGADCEARADTRMMMPRHVRKDIMAKIANTHLAFWRRWIEGMVEVRRMVVVVVENGGCCGEWWLLWRIVVVVEDGGCCGG